MVRARVRFFVRAGLLAIAFVSNAARAVPHERSIADQVVSDLHSYYAQDRFVWDRSLDQATKRVMEAYLDVARTEASDGQTMIEIRSEFFIHVFYDWALTVSRSSWGSISERFKSQRNFTLATFWIASHLRPVSDPVVREIFGRKFSEDVNGLMESELSNLHELARAYRYKLRLSRFGEYFASGFAGLLLLKAVDYYTGSVAAGEVTGMAGFFAAVFSLREFFPVLPSALAELEARQITAQILELNSEICEQLLNH